MGEELCEIRALYLAEVQLITELLSEIACKI